MDILIYAKPLRVIMTKLYGGIFMAGLSWIDVVLRIIPEVMIIILAGYAVSKKEMNLKLYLFSSFLLALISFVFKTLPISAALPMILTVISAVIILVFINKIKIIHAIISAISCFILIILSEGVNLFVLEKILLINTNEIFQDATPFLKYLYGLPSLLLFAAIVTIYYFISRRKTANNDELTE